jgi:hypothetical protein
VGRCKAGRKAALSCALGELCKDMGRGVIGTRKEKRKFVREIAMACVVCLVR